MMCLIYIRAPNYKFAMRLVYATIQYVIAYRDRQTDLKK
jgi:hypothetical protein